MYILKFIFKSLSMPAFFLFLTVASSSVLAETPNLWWQHIKLSTISQSECLDRAQSLLKDNEAGKIKTVEDSVLARNKTTNLVVECLSSNGEVEIVVIVAANNFKDGNKIYSTLVEAFKD